MQSKGIDKFSPFSNVFGFNCFHFDCNSSFPWMNRWLCTQHFLATHAQKKKHWGYSVSLDQSPCLSHHTSQHAHWYDLITATIEKGERYNTTQRQKKKKKKELPYLKTFTRISNVMKYRQIVTTTKIHLLNS